MNGQDKKLFLALIFHLRTDKKLPIREFSTIPYVGMNRLSHRP